MQSPLLQIAFNWTTYVCGIRSAFVIINADAVSPATFSKVAMGSSSVLMIMMTGHTSAGKW